MNFMPPMMADRQSPNTLGVTGTRWGRVISMLLLLAVFCHPPAFSSPMVSGKPFKTTPTLNHGQKWRMGYLESGTYNNYYKSLVATIEGLMRLKWMEQTDLPSCFDPDDSQGLWQWLNAHARSKYIDFVADACWSEQFNPEIRPRVREKVLTRLSVKKDLDLLLVMGTKAGLDLANNRHATPTVIASTTDAHAARIIKSVDDSGYDHVHATVDLKLHELQLQKFHEIFAFKRLGIAYRHSAVGRSTAAVDKIEQTARKLGFDLVTCDLNTVIPGTGEHERKKEKIVKCHQQLAPSVDAVYITRYAGGVTLDNLPNLLAPLLKYNLPTFSQAGPEEVAGGVLLSIAMSRFREIGGFYAATIAKIFNGAKPRELNQRFDQPARIAINLSTAMQIGYDPPVEILASADEIYE